jgi:glycosyltransferase involved in cell wall biosynthesis
MTAELRGPRADDRRITLGLESTRALTSAAMELLLVAPHFAPDFEGGTESVVRAQARELGRLGHRVRVIAGTDRAHAAHDVERTTVDGLEVAFLPRRGDEYYDLDLERPRMRGLVRDLARGCELVHVHHWSTLHAHLVRDLGAHAPVVVTLHDLFVTCPRFFRLSPDPAIRCPPRGEFDPCARCVAPATDWSHARLLSGFERRTRWIAAELGAARALVVPSRSQIERIGEYVDLDRARVHVVPHGLSAPLERVIARGWDGRERLRVLFLGHRSDVKGVRELVRAVAGLAPAERERVELVLLGDEVLPGYDRELAAAADGARLTFAGNYTLADLPRRLAEIGGAHLGAFPSRAWESYGLVPDELCALGLPAWVSDRGAPRERVGAAGRVLPAEDPAAWTRALSAVLADPAQLERERAALPRAARTAADAARELDELYRNLVEG